MPVAERPTRCPCLSGLPYSDCCKPFHLGTEAAPTAERLMRSRYSAYAIGDAPYLLETWHPTTRPRTIELDRSIAWLSLTIIGRTGGGMLDTTGTVEFVARYRSDGQRGEQHENSSFVREDRRWFYVSATD
jgi:SEC-C motif-containing protein